MFPGRQQRGVRVFNVVTQLAAIAVEPDIADHAVHRWRGAGGECGMADNGFGVGMLVVGLREHQAPV